MGPEKMDKRLENRCHGAWLGGTLYHSKRDPDIILGSELRVHAVDLEAPDDTAVLFVEEDLCTVPSYIGRRVSA